MNRQERVVTILVELTDLDRERFTETATLQGLDIDSLTATEIAMGLEEEFGIWFERDAELEWETVGDIFKAVEELDA